MNALSLRAASIVMIGCLLVLVAPGLAMAQPKRPVVVLMLESTGADDQADALTGSLRSRVRADPTLDLVESQTSLETFRLARCGAASSAGPDQACLDRIADELHADTFVWGKVEARGATVAATIHLYRRGQSDVVTFEEYSSFLTEANDDALKMIAAKSLVALADKVSGQAARVVIHAGKGGGEVLVDGESRGVLVNGGAGLVVAAGPHRFEVRPEGARSWEKVVTILEGETRELRDDGEPETSGAAAPPPVAPQKHGCACRMGGEDGTEGLAVLAVLGGAAAAVLRRRRRARSRSGYFNIWLQ